LSLAAFDFYLVPKMKIKLKGRTFDRVEEMQAKTQTVVINTLTKNQFEDALHKWEKLWDKCALPTGLLSRWPCRIKTR
jgi:hypothetical protein